MADKSKKRKGREECHICHRDQLIKATTGNPAVHIKYCRHCGVQVYTVKNG